MLIILYSNLYDFFFGDLLKDKKVFNGNED